MKNIVLIFISLILLSCNSDYSDNRIKKAQENRLKVGKVIDRNINKLKPKLPYDFNNGVIWIDVVKEFDFNMVYEYEVNYSGLEIVNNAISKNQIIQDMKASESYKTPLKYGYNHIYRYYYDGVIFKEIKIEPQDYR